MNDEVLDKISADLMDILAYVNELRNGAITPPVVPDRPPGLIRLVAPDGGPLSHAYATVDPWNCDHTGLLLEHSQGRIGLHYPDGKSHDGQWGLILPGARADGHAVWSRSSPFIFYMTTGNQLQFYDVRNNQLRTVRQFPEYRQVDIGVQEGDISEDGDYLPMCGDGRDAFLYRISTDTVGPVFPVPGLNAVYVTPDNHLIVTGAFGIRMVKNGVFVEIVSRFGHMDVGRDLDGSEIILWIDDTTNDITKVRLGDLKRTPLLRLDWALAVHNCLPYPGLDRKPVHYGIVSPYAPSGVDVPHARDILKVPLDGSTVTVLAQDKSDASTYSGQPHAVGSGNQFLFDSREGGQNVVYIGGL